MLAKLVVLLTILLLPSLTLQAKDRLNWLYPHWPPMMITKGEFQGQGRVDALWEIWVRHLPQYEHTKEEMTWARFWTNIKKGEHTCNPVAYKTPERERFAYFSDSNVMVLANSIIMSKDNIQKLGNPETYSLVRMLQDVRFEGILLTNRSYSPKLDALLAQHEADSNIKRTALQEHHLIQQIANQRIDYTLEYPFIAAFLDQTYNVPKATLGSVTIAEVKPYNFAFLACPMTPWGKQIIEDFNRVLEKVIPTREYRQIMERWHDNTNEINLIRKVYDSEFVHHP